MSSASNFHPSPKAVLESGALLQAQKSRPVIVEVPDVESPEFAAEARRQSLAIANSPHDKDDQAFVDSISIIWQKGEE